MRLVEVKPQAARPQQTDLLSRVSHELRTPLSAILGFVDLMRNDTATPLSPRHQDWAQHVLTAGQHLMAVIDDLLDLTRIDSGHHALQPVALPALRLLQNCQALLAPLAARHGSEFAAAAGDRELLVLADRRALGQVLINLIGNAIKFNRPGGSVQCEVQARGRELVFSVRDQGPGVPPEHRHRLFQPFERLGRPPASAEGTGLGLAITRRLVEAMSGRITAEFPQAGGTCMRVALPRASPGAGEHANDGAGSLRTRAQRASGQASAAPRRAIYAGDNAADAALLQAMFELRSDWTLELARSSAGLRAALAESACDLLICDLDPDREAGLNLARELNADPQRGDFTCVALSGQARGEPIADAMRAGVDDYWIKPIDLVALHRRLDSLPQRRKRPSR